MTVQEFFKSLNRDELVSEYLSYCNEPKSAKRKNRVKNLLDAFDSMQIIPNDSWIVFCEPNLGEHFIDSTVIKKEDLLDTEVETGNLPEGYAYELTSMSEILSYSVSKACIYAFGEFRVACAILYEMTFFGYDMESQKEKVEEESQNIQKAVEEVEKGIAKLIPCDEAFKQLHFVDTRKDFEKEFDQKKATIAHEISKKLKQELCKLEIHYLFENL